jgi:hypothetical protein
MDLAAAGEACGPDGKHLEALARAQGAPPQTPLAEYAAAHFGPGAPGFDAWYAAFPPTWRKYNSRRKIATVMRTLARLPRDRTGLSPELLAAWNDAAAELQRRLAGLRAAERACEAAAAEAEEVAGADAGADDEEEEGVAEEDGAEEEYGDCGDFGDFGEYEDSENSEPPGAPRDAVDREVAALRAMLQSEEEAGSSVCSPPGAPRDAVDELRREVAALRAMLQREAERGRARTRAVAAALAALVPSGGPALEALFLEFAT